MDTYVYRCPKGHETTAHGAWIDEHTGLPCPPESIACGYSDSITGDRCEEQTQLIGGPLDRGYVKWLRDNMASTFDEIRYLISQSRSGVFGSINPHNLRILREAIWKNGKELRKLSKQWPNDEELKKAVELFKEYCKAENVGEPPE